MTKFVPYEKLSKKKKRALDREKRGSRNGLCPVTRTSKNLKIYDRKRALKENDDSELLQIVRTVQKSPYGR